MRIKADAVYVCLFSLSITLYSLCTKVNGIKSVLAQNFVLFNFGSFYTLARTRLSWRIVRNHKCFFLPKSERTLIVFVST